MEKNMLKGNLDKYFHGQKMELNGMKGIIQKCRYCNGDEFTIIIAKFDMQNKVFCSIQPFCVKCQEPHFQVNVDEKSMVSFMQSMTKEQKKTYGLSD